MCLSDGEKLSLTLDVLQTTQDILEEGHDINDFMSYGIDLLATLLPDTASGDEFRWVWLGDHVSGGCGWDIVWVRGKEKYDYVCTWAYTLVQLFYIPHQTILPSVGETFCDL